MVAQQDQPLLVEQRAILGMIVRDAPVMETLAAVIAFAEQMEPGAKAGVTIVDRTARALEMAVFPSIDRAFADSLAGVALNPPHVGTCAQALYRGEVGTSNDLVMLCFPQPGGPSRFPDTLIATCATLTQLALERRGLRERHELMVGEFQHRTQNLFATIGALARSGYSQMAFSRAAKFPNRHQPDQPSPARSESTRSEMRSTNGQTMPISRSPSRVR